MTQSVEERNIRSIRDGIRAVNDRDFDLAVADFADDFVWYTNVFPKPIRGPQDAKERLEEMVRSHPGLRFSEKCILAGGNRVAVLMTVDGRDDALDFVLNTFDDKGRRIEAKECWDPNHVLASPQERPVLADRGKGAARSRESLEELIGYVGGEIVLPPGSGEIEKRNIRAVLHDIAAANRGDVKGGVATFDDDTVWYATYPPETFVGTKEAEKGLGELQAALPDLQFKMQYIFASGDLVAVLFEGTGTKIDGFMGLPPMEKRYSVPTPVITIFRKNGKRAFVWDVWDRAKVLRQLQVVERSARSFAGRETIITGEGDPALRQRYLFPPGRLVMPGASSPPSIETLLSGSFPPGADPETYRIHEVTRMLDLSASFPMETMRDAEPSVPILWNDHVVGVEIRQSLERLEAGPAAAAGRHRPSAKTAGVGRFAAQLRFIPEEFVAGADHRPPPLIFFPNVSQRFVLLDAKIDLDDAEKSGIRGIGTGRTFPIEVEGKRHLLFGAVVDAVKSSGRFRDRAGVAVINGIWKTPARIDAEVVLRVEDPGGDLAGQREEPSASVSWRASRRDPDLATVVLSGEMDPARPVTFDISPQGQFHGADGHEQLRLVDIRFSVGKEFYSAATIGPAVAEGNFRIHFDPLQPVVPYPFQTSDGSWTFHDLGGREIGAIHANITDGRAFPLRLPGAPLTVFRVGGLAPILAGSGIFQGVVGLITINTWLSLFPRALNTVMTLRFWDPGGRRRAALEKAWAVPRQETGRRAAPAATARPGIPVSPRTPPG